MVDRERVQRLLERIAEDVRQLRGYAEQRARPPAGSVIDAIKYRFITAIEGCARVAQHVIASEHWPVADTNADAVRRLATEGVLTETTGDSLARAVGFRNLLVHQYAEVDDERVVATLDRIEDLSAFVGQVAAWLEQST